jgi:hypothetical protein
MTEERDAARALTKRDSILRLDRDGDTLRLVIPPAPRGRGLEMVKALFAGALAVAFALARLALPVTVLGMAAAGAVIYVSVRRLITTHEVRLKRDGSGFLVRRMGAQARGIPLQAGQVRVRLVQRVESDRHMSRQIEFLALDHGTETYELLDGYSHAERAWALEEIAHWLGQ